MNAADGGQRAQWKQGFRELAQRRPMTNLIGVVSGVAIWLLFAALGYAVNPNGSFGNGVSAGIGLLVGMGVLADRFRLVHCQGRGEWLESSPQGALRLIARQLPFVSSLAGLRAAW